MARKGISEIFEMVQNAPELQQKVAILRAFDNPVLRDVSKMAYDADLKWVVPETMLYTPCPFPYMENSLYKEFRKVYLFVEGGNPNLHPIKRQALFKNFLETLDPQDAELMMAVRNKKMPYNIPAEVFEAAWPGWMPVRVLPPSQAPVGGASLEVSHSSENTSVDLNNLSEIAKSKTIGADAGIIEVQKTKKPRKKKTDA